MKVLKYPNEILTTRSEPVELTEEVKEFCREMTMTYFEELRWGVPVGLAAPQVGKNWRIFIMQGIVCINPEITWITKAPKDMSKEGCYSLSDNRFDYPTERAPSLVMMWTDMNGNTQQQRFNGFLAHVIQHEMDHLDGKLCYELVVGVDMGHSDGDKSVEHEIEVCEFCNGSGEVFEDEYEGGQIVGVGTVGPKVCICKLNLE